MAMTRRQLLGIVYATAELLVLWNVSCHAEDLVLNLQCGNSQYRCPGRRVEINCTVNSLVMRWTMEEEAIEQSRQMSFSRNDMVGMKKKTGPFVAIVTWADEQKLWKTTSLSFTFEKYLNNTSVTCEKAEEDKTDTCLFFIYELPEPVTNVTSSIDHCKIHVSWESPARTSLEFIWYNITLMAVPPPEIIGDYNSTPILTTPWLKTEMSFLVNLNTLYVGFNIQACNCAGCGEYLNTTIMIAQNNSILDNESMTTISPPSYSLNKQENGNFGIKLEWTNSIQKSCFAGYLVSMQVCSMSHACVQVQYNSTLTQMYIQDLESSKNYSFCVIGITEGPHTAQCSDTLEVYLEVPMVVSDLNVTYETNATTNIITLFAKWTAPSIGTRPKIDGYILSYLDEEVNTTSTNVTVVLNYTCINDRSLEINVSAINIVGRGSAAIHIVKLPGHHIMHHSLVLIIGVVVTVSICILCIIVNVVAVVIGVLVRQCNDRRDEIEFPVINAVE